jgi:hypothetical protein
MVLSKRSSKKTIRKAWVAALRSRKYFQGSGSLHVSTKKNKRVVHRFCCLGVLCDLAEKAGVCAKEGLTLSTDGNGAKFLYDNKGATLPLSVRLWAGVKNKFGRFEDKYSSNSLADINDNGELNFRQIADLIESKPKELFLKE